MPTSVAAECDRLEKSLKDFWASVRQLQSLHGLNVEFVIPDETHSSLSYIRTVGDSSSRTIYPAAFQTELIVPIKRCIDIVDNARLIISAVYNTYRDGSYKPKSFYQQKWDPAVRSSLDALQNLVKEMRCSFATSPVYVSHLLPFRVCSYAGVRRPAASAFQRFFLAMCSAGHSDADPY